MASRSPSRDRYRSRTRSPTSRSDYSRSPERRRRFDSRSPTRSPSPPTRRNGRFRSGSPSRSHGRDREERGRSATPVMKSTKIVVERLSKNINEDHLYEIFGQFGHVKDLDLPINRTNGSNRGTAYILFDHEADAEAAIAHMHEAQVDGATINVSIVLPRRKLSNAPPTARRGANIDPRIPFAGPRGLPPGLPAGGGPHQAGRTFTAPDLVPRRGRQGAQRPREVAAVDIAVVPTTHIRPDHALDLLLPRGDEEEAAVKVTAIAVLRAVSPGFVESWARDQVLDPLVDCTCPETLVHVFMDRVQDKQDKGCLLRPGWSNGKQTPSSVRTWKAAAQELGSLTQKITAEDTSPTDAMTTSSITMNLDDFFSLENLRHLASAALTFATSHLFYLE
ncbi:hypothetical protein G7046_g4542 [Stylonectria norvegica]|nr:hypothetical protein G7046_g4542 [Stylonectria norvegica]